MSTALEEPPAATTPPAERLRRFAAAMRLSFTWFGVRKTLTPQQKEQAAESFGAEGNFLSAGKKLIDTKHPAFKAVTSVRNRIVSYWRGVSLPFPEPGIRLIRQDDVAVVDQRLGEMKSELIDAVIELDRELADLKLAARQQLGQLYNEADYPGSLHGLFDVVWDFPSIEPPAYLQQLSPALYEQECQRMSARFNEAVQLAEQAFTEELAKLVSHLSERLTGAGAEDGKPKIFRDTAITNLTEFFERFRHLNIRSNEQLDQLVNQAQGIVRGVQPQALREREGLRQRVSKQLAGVQSALDGLLVDRPRRRIIRGGGNEGGS
ncbi:MAG: hypothetical protein WD768_05930 [Phycisphaeraceae bacterium]